MKSLSRHALFCLLFCLGFLSVTGCVAPVAPQAPDAASSDATAPVTPEASADAASETTGEDCRIISHDMGETEVCGTPQNVIALGLHMLDLLLSLGVQASGFAETQYINEEDWGNAGK